MPLQSASGGGGGGGGQDYNTSSSEWKPGFHDKYKNWVHDVIFESLFCLHQLLNC